MLEITCNGNMQSLRCDCSDGGKWEKMEVEHPFEIRGSSSSFNWKWRFLRNNHTKLFANQYQLLIIAQAQRRRLAIAWPGRIHPKAKTAEQSPVAEKSSIEKYIDNFMHSTAHVHHSTSYLQLICMRKLLHLSFLATIGQSLRSRHETTCQRRRLTVTNTKKTTIANQRTPKPNQQLHWHKSTNQLLLWMGPLSHLA